MRRFLLIVLFLLSLLISCDSKIQEKPTEHYHSFSVAENGYLVCSGCNTTISDEYIAEIENGEIKSYKLLSNSDSSSYLNINADTISYTNNSINTSDRSVVIYTVQERNFKINAPREKVFHYGKVGNIEIEDLSLGRYIENGTVTGILQIIKGNIELNTQVSNIIVGLDGDTTIALSNNAKISKISSKKEYPNNQYMLLIKGKGQIGQIESDFSFILDGPTVDKICHNSSYSSNIRIKGTSFVQKLFIDSMSFKDLVIDVEDKSKLNEVFSNDLNYNDWLKVNSPSHVHIYGPKLQIKEATCEESGLERFLCTCGNIIDEKTIPLGHNIIHYQGKKPTCLEPGYLEYDSCSRCNYSSYEPLPSLGHDIKKIPAKEPNCTEVGWDEYESCSRCDYSTKGEDIPALGHKFSSEWDSDSTYHWHPAICGHSEILSDKSEHLWNEMNKCEVCGIEKSGTGVIVVVPTKYTLSIEFPSDWNGSFTVIPNVYGLLKAIINPSREDAVFKFTIDGSDVLSSNGVLTLGVDETTLLNKGSHEITVFTLIDDFLYSESYRIIVSENGTGHVYKE